MSWNKKPAMNFDANWGRPGRFGRIRRFAARHPVSALLLLGLPIVVAGLAPFMADPTSYGTGVVRATEIVLFLLAPTVLIGTLVYGPRIVRGVLRRVADNRARNNPQPTGPPIEQLAADLRRLLWRHDTVRRSTDELRLREMPGDTDTPIIVAMRVRRLWALEGAITDCATKAARALEVPHPPAPAYGGLDKPRLRRLLRDLADAGLVLPPAVGLLASDGHL
jgi:hypothetical protein